MFEFERRKCNVAEDGGGAGRVGARRRPHVSACLGLRVRRAFVALLTAALVLNAAPTTLWAAALPAAAAEDAAQTSVAASGTAAQEGTATAGGESAAATDGTTDAAGGTITGTPAADETTSGQEAATGDAASSAGSGVASADGATDARRDAAADDSDSAASSADAASASQAAGTAADANASSAEDAAAGAQDAQTITVTAKVVGISDFDDEGSCSYQDWIPLSEVTVQTSENATAWDVFSKLLDQAGYTYQANALGPTSITDPSGRELDSDFTPPYWYWSFYVNSLYANEGCTTYRLKDGDSIELRYVFGDIVPEDPNGSVEVDPTTPHPDMDSDWQGFGNGGAGSVTDAATPTEQGKAAWAAGLLTDDEVEAGASLFVSDPIVAGGKLYVVSGSTSYGPAPTFTPTRSLARLQVIDPATGAVERQVTLGTTMDATCRPVYAQGIIVIPLSGGYLQAVSATTLKTLWVVPATSNGQSLCTLTVEGDYVYVAGLDGIDESSLASSGSVVRYRLSTGARVGLTTNKTAGYYWAGGVTQGEYYVIGDDAGTVHVFSSDLSREVSALDISVSPLRSTFAVYGGFIYAVSRDDGVLHKLAVDASGSVREVASVKFAGYSTSSPSISGGYAFVGGATGSGWGSAGILAVVNLSTMSVTATVSTAAGAALPGDVKSAPLVATRNGSTYVYFTCNGAAGDYPNYTSGGGIYLYRLGDAEASVLFQPGEGMANYCTASIVCDAAGNLYYTNDSGHLFKVTAAAGTDGGDGGQDNGGQDSGNDGSSSNGGSSDAGSAAGGSANAGAQATGPAALAKRVSAPAAAFAPLSRTAGAQGSASGATGDTAEPTAASATRTRSSDAARADDADLSASAERAGFNPWALGAAIAGAAVLIAAAIYLVATRRRTR